MQCVSRTPAASGKGILLKALIALYDGVMNKLRKAQAIDCGSHYVFTVTLKSLFDWSAGNGNLFGMAGRETN